MLQEVKLIFLTFCALNACVGGFTNIVKPNSVDAVSKNLTIRDVENLFDDNRDTQTLIYSDLNKEAFILLNLPGEYQVETVEIILDEPSQIEQSVWIGYGRREDETSSSLRYGCLINKNSVVCQPPCKSSTSREGVVGSSILWTLKRTVQKGWTRIYDVVIRGRSLEELSTSYGRNGDITFLKPYTVDGHQPESCTVPIWKLTDSSKVTSGVSALSETPHNVTFQFGRTCLVNRVGLMLSASDQAVKETVVHFGGPKSFTKVINIVSDCVTQADNEMHFCETKDLSGYPFTNITVDAMALVRIHVYGLPLLYPRIGIVPSPKTATAESIYRIEIKCVALSCNSNIVMQLEAMVHGKPIDPCSRQGWSVQCANMELLRVHASSDENHGASPFMPDTVLVSNGQVLPEVAQVMTEMKLVDTTPNQITVSMPRTHPYYGQYRCRCQTDDQIASTIQSVQTSLQPTEFDQDDLVFQRNYSAIFNDELIESHLGILELPDDQQVSYFRLVIAGHSLTQKLDLNATFLESGQLASMTGDYAQITSVPAFPRAKGAKYAWPIPAYRVELQEAWPDAVDGEAITIEWSTTEESVNVRKVKDILRTIVLSPSRDGHMRGWVWERNAHVIDLRAYYQIGAANPKPIEFYLKRLGCSSNGSEDRVGSVRVEGDECLPTEGSVMPSCEKTNAGFVIQFVITQPSASDTYELFARTDDDSTDKQLVHSAAVVRNLKTELDETEIALKIVSIDNDAGGESTPMDVIVVVHSKVIVDNSACRRMHLTLHPTWPVDERLEQQLSKNETMFHLSVPNDQRLVTLDLELRIEPTGDDSSETAIRRSLTIPNPRHYIPDLTKDEATGKIEWSSLPVPFRGLLDHFQVKLFRTDHVCGMREEIQPPPVRQDYANGAPVYKLRLADLPDFDSDVQVEYEAEITPLLKSSNTKEPIHGAVAIAGVARGKIGQSIIKQHVPLTSRSTRFYVLPSQLASCLRGNRAMTVTFEIHVIGEDQITPNYVSDVRFEPDQDEATSEIGRWYTARNLLPGRRYEINATVHYPTGEHDQPSPFIPFWTSDELIVETKESFVSPGDRAVFNCTGAVGPENAYRKRLEWRREDGTPLPEGSRVEVLSATPTGPDWKEIVALIFERVEPGQANTYACFIRPSVLELIGQPFVPPKVKMVVTELELDKQSYVAAYGDSVTVTCASAKTGELAWIAPDGQAVLMTEQETNPFTTADAERKNSLQLHIPKVVLEQTGEYICMHKDSPNTRSFHLRLTEDILLSSGAGSSRKASEKLILNCTAHYGQSNQKIAWYQRKSATAPWIPLTTLEKQFPSIHVKTETGTDNTRYSILTWINSPSSNGQYACALEEVDNVKSESEFVPTKLKLPEHSATYETKTEPSIEVKTAFSGSEQEVTVRCTGYPAHETDRLNWFFLPEGYSEVDAIPVEPELEGSSSHDSELVELIRKTFRLGDYTPASWPGASGPVLLAASGKISSRMIEPSLVSPESLEVIVVGPLDERLRSGSLICHYRRPSAIVLIKDDLSIFTPGRTSSDEFESIAQERIAMNKVSSALSKQPIDSAAGRSASIENDGANTSVRSSYHYFVWAMLCLTTCVLFTSV